MGRGRVYPGERIDCLKTSIVRAFSPVLSSAIASWGFAPSWYKIAPSALKSKRNHEWERQGREQYQPEAKPQE